MPYIDSETREVLQLGSPAENAGELNFQITKLLVQYLLTHGKSYQVMNDVVGALEGAKAEFQRRVVNPYENTKLSTNGDVY